MRTKKSLVREQSVKIVDEQSGELLETKNYQTSRIEAEPDFVKLYLADIIRLKELPKGCNPILHELLKYMNYMNEVILNSYAKRCIAQALDIKVNTLEHYIKKIVECGIATRKAPGTYFLNPDLFGKGKWQDIRELRFSIKYDAGGRTFHIEKDTQLELHGNGFDFVTFEQIEQAFK